MGAGRHAVPRRPFTDPEDEGTRFRDLRKAEGGEVAGRLVAYAEWCEDGVECDGAEAGRDFRRARQTSEGGGKMDQALRGLGMRLVPHDNRKVRLRRRLGGKRTNDVREVGSATARSEAARPVNALREADVEGRAIDGGQIRRQRHGRQDGKRGPPRPRAKPTHAARIRQGGKCLKCL